MPKDTPRVEVLFSAKTRRRLESYRLQLCEKTGKKVSKTKLVESIVEQFLDKNLVEGISESRSS